MKITESIKELYADTDFRSKEFDPRRLLKSLTPEDDVSEIRQWALGKGLSATRWKDAHRTWKQANRTKAEGSVASQFVAQLAADWTLRVRFDGLIMRGGGAVGAHEIEKEIRLERDRLALQLGDDGALYGDLRIRDAFDVWLRDEREARLKSIGKTLAYDPALAGAQDAMFLDLARAISDTDYQSLDYVAAVLKSVVWQVKRRIAGKPIYDHLMAVAAGPQGAGKSVFWQKFTSPLEELVTKANFNQLTDDRDHDIWRSPVIFLDEMEKSQGADMDAVKNAITKETHSARVLYSSGRVTIVCRHVCIGAMNGFVSDKLKDPTGLRRFGPFIVLPSRERVSDPLAPTTDWTAINACDYLKLWQSVDEDGPHPIKAVWAELVAIQERERLKDSVELWLAEVKPKHFDLPRDGSFTATDLRKSYAEFCESNGYKALSTNPFAKALAGREKDAGFPFTPVSRTGSSRKRSWSAAGLARGE